MSSTLVEVKKTAKKRKHEGDSSKSKKKQKNLDDAAVSMNEGEEVAKAERKEKKRSEKHKKRMAEAVDEGDTTNSRNGNGTLKPSPELSGSAKKDKQKKKSSQDAHSSQPAGGSDDEKESPVPDRQEDEEMQDAPEVGQDEPNVAQHVTTTNGSVVDTDSDQLQSDAETSFHSTRMSLNLPIPAIASSGHLSAILALHLSPLLLTYFPPAKGVILSYHDPVLSARPEPGPNRPFLPPATGMEAASSSDETLVRVGEEFGASWAWLTVTFLVFTPQPGNELQGWTNAMSEGFIGLVSYNYFQSSIPKQRIPKNWSWNGPNTLLHKQKRTPRKGKLNDSDGPSQENYVDSQETAVAGEDDDFDGMTGSFVDENGTTVQEKLKFRVVDLEMIPAQERGQRFALQLEGTLLGPEEEEAVRQEEKEKWEARVNRSKSRSRNNGTPMMSGGLPTHSRAGSVVSMS